MLWPIFLLLGWEQVRIDPANTAVTPLDFIHYPISHSLLACVLWALAFGGVYFAITRYARGAVILAIGVLSHWFLDFVSHRADLPLTFAPESQKWGLGLWDSLPATLFVEGTVFSVGLWIYFRSTRAKDRVGSWGMLGFIATLLLIYFANIFGPPPPNEAAIAIVGTSAIVLLAWPYWADHHRVLR